MNPTDLNTFYERFLQQIEIRFPEVANQHSLKTLVSPTLVSPHTLELSADILEKAREIVRAFYHLRITPAYQTQVHPRFAAPPNSSLLMSYDFHLIQQQTLKLIEINTNASMSLMAHLLYETQNLPNPTGFNFQEAILAAFKEEMSSVKNTNSVVVILDENPPTQRLYIEFLLYQALIHRELKVRCVICDPSDLELRDKRLFVKSTSEAVGFIYNRHTDFYLETSPLAGVREAWLNREVVLSPNPYEYELLADKSRLLDLTHADWNRFELSEKEKSAIQNALIPTIDLAGSNTDEIWQKRKNLFFKPKRSFGGKAVYRGASISRPTFEKLMAQDFLAQEFTPPPTVSLLDGNGQKAEFKCDLRFFVYRDTIQLCTARLYQGQMTNAQTVGGGTTALRLSASGPTS